MPFDRRSSDDVVAAVVLTVKVEVPVPPLTEAGLKAHVGPRVADGATVHVKATAAVKPFTGAMVIVEVEAAPGAIVAGASGEALMVKSGAMTVTLSALVWVTEPTPLTVTVYPPAGVVAVVLTVKAQFPVPPGIEAGTKAHVGGEATTGVTEQDKATLPVKPFNGATETVDVADDPADTVAGVSAVALSVKSGASLNATDWMTQLPVTTGAVASQLPIAAVIRCSELSPFGRVSEVNANPAPGPVTVFATVAPATTNSTGVAVAQTPVSARAEEPMAPTLMSTGFAISRPLYSSTRTSGACAA